MQKLFRNCCLFWSTDLSIKTVSNTVLLYVGKSLRLNSMSSAMDVGVSDMRIAYHGRQNVYLESNLTSKEPIGQFKSWFEEAQENPEIAEANAMCLSTASVDGAPSARFVLLKGYGIEGFKFFTNYESRKGKELAENPRAALTFYWEPLRRSVRIEGTVERLSEKESNDYFHSRPVSSQIGACVSQQSVPLAGREELYCREQEYKLKYENSIVPRPKFWGGYIVSPLTIEFWQGQTDRLHDRIRFRKPQPGEVPDGKLLHEGTNGWVFERLSP